MKLRPVVDRRQLLGGLAAGAGALLAERAVAGLRLNSRGRGQTNGGGGGGVIPLVGPATTWNGTAGTGDAAPTSTARTTANPTAGAIFLQPDLMRFNTTMRLSVYADAAFGGIDHIVFSGDIAPTTLSGPALDTNLGPDGAPRNIGAWHIDLDATALLARTGGARGQLKIYAKVFPANVNMVPRLIGPLTWTVGDPDATILIGPSRTLKTINDALNTIASNGYQHPLVLMDTATYEAANGSTNYAGIKSWATFKPNAGQTVNISRTTPVWNNSVSGTPYSNDAWILGMSFVRFEGVNIDPKNFTILAGGGAAGTFNDSAVYNCNIVNSLGTTSTFYWNHDPKPYGVFGGTYVEYCTIKHVNFALGSTVLAVKNKVFDSLFSPMNNAPTTPVRALWNTFVKMGWDASANAILAQRIQMTLTYTGTTATATATLTGPGGTLTISVAGHADLVYAFGGENTASYFLTSALASKINADASANGITGLTATGTANVDDYNTQYLWLVPNGFNLFDGTTNPYNVAGTSGALNIKGATLGFGAGFNYHADIWDQSDHVVDNAFMVGNAFFQVRFLDPFHMTVPSLATEVFFTDNFVHYIHTAPPGSDQQSGSWAGDHFKATGNGMWCEQLGISGWSPYLASQANNSTFIELAVNVGFHSGGDSNWAADVPVKDSYVDYNGLSSTSVLNSGSNSGNIVGSNCATGGANTLALFTAPSMGDPRPLGSGPLAANLRTPRTPYSMRGQKRRASDATGPMSLDDANEFDLSWAA